MIAQPVGWLRKATAMARSYGAPLIADEVMTGGYLPMAATLTTQKVFDSFLGKYSDFRTFFHGHSYTANQLGAAASLASLDLVESPASNRARTKLQSTLA